MHGMNGINERKDCTRAYTGIASDTPVGVHLSPHLSEIRGSQSRMKNVSYGCPNCPHWTGGSYVPILELMGLYVPLP